MTIDVVVLVLVIVVVSEDSRDLLHQLVIDLLVVRLALDLDLEH